MKTYWPAFRLGGLLLATGALLPWFAGAQALKNVTLSATPATSVSEVDVTRTGHDHRARGKQGRSAHLPRYTVDGATPCSGRFR